MPNTRAVSCNGGRAPLLTRSSSSQEVLSDPDAALDHLLRRFERKQHSAPTGFDDDSRQERDGSRDYTTNERAPFEPPLVALVPNNNDGQGPNYDDDIMERHIPTAALAYESTRPEFVIHQVTPADTLGGLELRYGVSGTVIRRLNGMSSDRLTS